MKRYVEAPSAEKAYRWLWPHAFASLTRRVPGEDLGIKKVQGNIIAAKVTVNPRSNSVEVHNTLLCDTQSGGNKTEVTLDQDARLMMSQMLKRLCIVSAIAALLALVVGLTIVGVAETGSFLSSIVRGLIVMSVIPAAWVVVASLVWSITPRSSGRQVRDVTITSPHSLGFTEALMGRIDIEESQRLSAPRLIDAQRTRTKLLVAAIASLTVGNALGIMALFYIDDFTFFGPVMSWAGPASIVGAVLVFIIAFMTSPITFNELGEAILARSVVLVVKPPKMPREIDALEAARGVRKKR